MSRIYNNVTELIGNTPLISLKNYCSANNIKANIIGKLEYFNPGGSVKDRIAYAMIEKAERENLINKNTTIIEPTSGNTGIGLAAVCASRGYKIILTMPETMSIERRKLLKAYGAEIVLTDGALGMRGAINKANEIALSIPDSFIPAQFDNIANPDIHKKTTAREIWEDMDGKIAAFVAGVGTGGTITGVGEYLKSLNKDIKIIAVEPYDSPVLSGGNPGPHKIQGIGAGFVPSILNTEIYDEVIKVSNEDAINKSREIGLREGILVGISSGAAIVGATVIASYPEFYGKNIVVLLPDTGERYLTTTLFDN